ncbi:MAG: hypothetical protein H0V76_02875 [Blastocatellia bacterium]|nr:hypothetical protein [Blastocatellia bacterium]
MIHFVYLVAFGLLISLVFAAFADGTVKERTIYGLKSFAQFIGISLLIAWVLYFIP